MNTVYKAMMMSEQPDASQTGTNKFMIALRIISVLGNFLNNSGIFACLKVRQHVQSQIKDEEQKLVNESIEIEKLKEEEGFPKEF